MAALMGIVGELSILKHLIITGQTQFYSYLVILLI